MLTAEDIRFHELGKALEIYEADFKDKSLLEIGSGKGRSLKQFKAICKKAKGVDIENGSCATEKIEDVIYYNGYKLPFEDKTFDIIFSSSVLEHIPHLDDMQKEFQRVLKDDGVAIHILPNATWRVSTLLMHYVVLPISIYQFIKRRVSPPKAIENNATDSTIEDSPKVVNHTLKSLIMDTLMARRHGEKGNRITEIYYFSEMYWIKYFKKSGWKNVTRRAPDLFYSNYSIGLSKEVHMKLSKFFGSSETIFRMEK